jgi:hypothetical protein
VIGAVATPTAADFAPSPPFSYVGQVAALRGFGVFVCPFVAFMIFCELSALRLNLCAFASLREVSLRVHSRSLFASIRGC